ncbi:hypothetical protein JR316_0007980 [Psilocybe cubensis]|uniref:F-box domain-containing protein n=2 Tax=Psilocybe cubensis TaxID=181762 RepID=A0A8H7XSW1_PSICU|nr:hypothetical protein JR316_0007980 [Psilocybe cubensis]KAH9479390.1 hypothetical protein JR316_0007980 [Psilocybe cubensis]
MDVIHLNPKSNKQHLPQEIFDCVIDHLHDDTNALRACALVSASWRASAQQHLFRRITLGPWKRKTQFFALRPAPSPCARLVECIRNSGAAASVAPYIHELHLQEGIGARTWFEQESVILAALLRALSNLRRLDISPTVGMHIYWERLPGDLKRALEGSMKLASLTELKLGGVAFVDFGEVHEVLRKCVFLRVLEVDHLLVQDESLEELSSALAEAKYVYSASDPRKTKGTRDRTPLDVLVIGPRTPTAFVAFLLDEASPFAVDAVRKLTASLSGSFPEFARLLHACTSVENLELTLMNDVSLQGYWTLPDNQRFDLSQVPRLKNLKVNIDVLQKMDDPLPWLGALFRTGVDASLPTRLNKVESIWIVYSIYLPAPYMDRSANVAIFDKWRDIDRILSGESDSIEAEKQGIIHIDGPYGNLNRVKLDFMLENPIGFGIAPRFMRELVLESPGLERKDILRVKAFDTSK